MALLWAAVVLLAAGVAASAALETTAEDGTTLYALGALGFASRNSSDALWTWLGPGLPWARVLAEYNGVVYAGGKGYGVATWNPRLRDWEVVGGGFFGESWGETYVSSMVVFRNELYVAGKFYRAGRSLAGSIARWNGADWFGLGTMSQCGNGNNRGIVSSLVVVDSTLYFVGNVGLRNNVCQYDSNRILKWTGSELSVHPYDTSLGPQTQNHCNVDGLAEYKGKLTVICGRDSETDDAGRPYSAEATARSILSEGDISSASFENLLYVVASPVWDRPNDCQYRWNGITWQQVSSNFKDRWCGFNIFVFQNRLYRYLAVNCAIEVWNGHAWLGTDSIASVGITSCGVVSALRTRLPEKFAEDPVVPPAVSQPAAAAPSPQSFGWGVATNSAVAYVVAMAAVAIVYVVLRQRSPPAPAVAAPGALAGVRDGIPVVQEQDAPLADAAPVPRP